MTPWALLWFPIVYSVVSATEYIIHRWHMHKKGWINWFDPSMYAGHAKKHHIIFNPRKMIDPTEEQLDDVPHPIGYLWLVGLVFAIPVGLLGWFADNADILAGAPVLLASSVLWGYAWNWLHVRIHTPGWTPGNRVTRYLRDYHEQHHINQSTNYNSLAIGTDHLMGTYKNG